MGRISLILAGVAVAAAAGYGGYYYVSRPPARPATVNVPASADRCSLNDTALRDASDRPLAASAWQGRVVLLNFWASWCEPCRHEMPALQAVARRYASQGLRVIGVAVDNPSAAQKFARIAGVGYPLLYGMSAADRLHQACGAKLQGLPMSVVLDRQGHVCARHAGALDENGFAELLRSCLVQ
jgi:thiol-disulfide isomerase/thioredoxin